MIMLAIDTSSAYLSIAVMKNGKTASRIHKKAAMMHSSILVPSIDKALKTARLKIKDVDCFAVSTGPGSFTGLRIGVTTVKGLAYALKKKIVAVPTLDVIANNVTGFRGIICPVLDARKNKIYACFYRSDGKKINRISKYLLIPFEELMKKAALYDSIIFLGDAPDLTGKQKGKKINWYPDAGIVARLGAEYYKKKQFTSAEALEPLYLYSRECDIKGI